MSATTYYYSPIGWIEIQASYDAVTSLVFCDERKKEECNDYLQQTCKSDYTILTECVRQLDEYFSGQLTKFDLPVSQRGTDFQQNVWNALMGIPFGKTVSYGDVAKMLHHPQAVRAVGAANSKNRVWLVVPCHRVIGANGSLTGYAGGIERKKWLLVHESNIGSSFKLDTQNLKVQTSYLKPHSLTI